MPNQEQFNPAYCPVMKRECFELGRSILTRTLQGNSSEGRLKAVKEQIVADCVDRTPDGVSVQVESCGRMEPVGFNNSSIER